MPPWAISRQVRVGMLTPRRLAIRRAVSSRRAVMASPAFDQTRRTANQHAGADGENAFGDLRLSPYPAEHLLVPISAS